jgi:hypothetical protein
MALVWLKLSPTYELLGLLFGLHRRNARLNVRDILEVLGTLDDFPFDRPDGSRRKLASLAEVMRDFPTVRLVQVYRGAVLRHAQVARAVAVLVNRQTRVRPLQRYDQAA